MTAVINHHRLSGLKRQVYSLSLVSQAFYPVLQSCFSQESPGRISSLSSRTLRCCVHYPRSAQLCCHHHKSPLRSSCFPFYIVSCVCCRLAQMVWGDLLPHESLGSLTSEESLLPWWVTFTGQGHSDMDFLRGTWFRYIKYIWGFNSVSEQIINNAKIKMVELGAKMTCKLGTQSWFRS